MTTPVMASHWECPEGKVLCVLCFKCFALEDLHVLPSGKPEDVCKACAERESRLMGYPLLGGE